MLESKYEYEYEEDYAEEYGVEGDSLTECLELAVTKAGCDLQKQWDKHCRRCRQNSELAELMMKDRDLGRKFKGLPDQLFRCQMLFAGDSELDSKMIPVWRCRNRKLCRHCAETTTSLRSHQVMEASAKFQMELDTKLLLFHKMLITPPERLFNCRGGVRTAFELLRGTWAELARRAATYPWHPTQRSKALGPIVYGIHVVPHYSTGQVSSDLIHMHMGVVTTSRLGADELDRRLKDCYASVARRLKVEVNPDRDVDNKYKAKLPRLSERKKISSNDEFAKQCLLRKEFRPLEKGSPQNVQAIRYANYMARPMKRGCTPETLWDSVRLCHENGIKLEHLYGVRSKKQITMPELYCAINPVKMGKKLLVRIDKTSFSAVVFYPEAPSMKKGKPVLY
ncbi:hypothetical protein Pla22_42340 [Rubripirellula amarantea]|uniref:Uncharacterized protein n=1 Tax=Rubripirellula amarantea TaxID=2527999 RepID=A0A5C5WKY9_9BACT|nr:hypothetical protein [Rubripirellula amarantea]TWT51456.1 hypothetical protein Pla22_42340 [Rubripirellula amarantea]